MPKLNVQPKIAEVSLKSVEGGVVKIRTRMTGADAEAIYKMRSAGEDKLSVLEPILLVIVDWNLEGEDGQKLPVSIETLRQIPLDDVMALYEHVEDIKRFLPQSA